MRVHVIDEAESPLFLEEGAFVTGVVVSSLAAHDSSLVSAVGLTDAAEPLLVPNTRLEHVSAEDFARVADAFKIDRNRVREGRTE